MRSYGLGTAFTMLIAALYAFQNRSSIVVRFLVWERNLPQGVWEIALFALGCVVMWVVSLSAIWENRHKYTGSLKEQKLKVKELEETISVLRDEKSSLMAALRRADTAVEKKDGEGASSLESENKKATEVVIQGKSVQLSTELTGNMNDEIKVPEHAETDQDSASAVPDDSDLQGPYLNNNKEKTTN